MATFVAFFVVFDLLSTVLVARQYGEWAYFFEVNAFVHLAGINGLASMKVGVMILAVGAIVLFSRYQQAIGAILIGLAVAGFICGTSNFYLLRFDEIPSLGPVDAVYMAGVAISIALMVALIDAIWIWTGRRVLPLF